MMWRGGLPNARCCASEVIMSRNHWPYRLKDGRQTVYIGKTNDLDARAEEHRAEGKRFTRLLALGRAMTKDSALRREEEALRAYRRTHHGRNPRYNLTRHG